MLYPVRPRILSGSLSTRVAYRTMPMLLTLAFMLQIGAADAQKKQTSISIVPSVTSLVFQNGQFLASGTASAVIHGKSFSTTFSNVPATLGLAANQAGATDCPILSLSLAPINLNILGLVVQTSAICLDITAHQGGGLLGNLLCGVANLLNQGVPLGTILGGLTSADLATLNSGLIGLLNGALGQLTNALLTAINLINSGHTCAILHLELGPLDLNLLGLEVHLYNCASGPVTVDITALTGRGNLLGNLLCQLLDGGLINIGSTLQSILNQIIGLLQQ